MKGIRELTSSLLSILLSSVEAAITPCSPTDVGATTSTQAQSEKEHLRQPHITLTTVFFIMMITWPCF